jgi:hypothetical protein
MRVVYVASSLALGGGVWAAVNAKMNDAAESATTNARTINRSPPSTFDLSPPPRTIPPPRTTFPFTVPHVPLPSYPPPPPIGTFATVPSGRCSPHYSGCVPIDSDVDCWRNDPSRRGNGPSYQYSEVSLVDGSDPYGLDGDGDGIGCDGL